MQHINNNRGKQMLGLLSVCTWFALASYATWFFFIAKTEQPLTINELALKYKTHKQQTMCNTPQIQTIIVKNNNIIGFECKCGFRFVQERLLTQRISSYKPYRIWNLQEMKLLLNKVGLQYVSIRKNR
jgi:hypothetical protein